MCVHAKISHCLLISPSYSQTHSVFVDYFDAIDHCFL
uniref:Uncharacterized protein n=1 Tax=Arundo donax TaxID=35708 RepID=A0A0A9H467_ARUDO